MNRVTFNLHEHGFRDRPLLSNWSPHHYIPNSPLSEEININHASKKDRNRYNGDCEYEANNDEEHNKL